ncbi:MAG: hypothetical protein KTR27_08765 [Leptolyngbyaceae cyanobacterium MAG.088]|nr:hypothetical protein [Leptolyngbyaceae cyanobacterium MAG.088]
MYGKTTSPRQTLNHLRARRLGWLVPFYCCIDSYYTENGLDILNVFTWRFGKQAWETWHIQANGDADWLTIKAAPARLYNCLRLSGDLVNRRWLGGN